MPQNDPPVAATELLGRVMNIRRGSRSFVPARRVGLAYSAFGWVLCRSDRLRGLVLRLHAARLTVWRHIGRPSVGSFENSIGFSGISVSRHL